MTDCVVSECGQWASSFSPMLSHIQMVNSQFWVTKKRVRKKDNKTTTTLTNGQNLFTCSRPYELLVSIDIKINEHTSPSRLMYGCMCMCFAHTHSHSLHCPLTVPCEFRWLRRECVFCAVLADFACRSHWEGLTLGYFFGTLNSVYGHGHEYEYVLYKY